MRIFVWILILLQVSFVLAYEPKNKKKFNEKESAQIQGMRYACWSPDGKWIAFSLYGDIWKMPVEGGRAQRITLHEADDMKPRWSPDGKTIAFSSDRMGNFDVWTISADGGNPRQITFHGGWDSVSDWTPDGEWIIFYSYRSDNVELWKIRKDGGNAVQITCDGGRDASVSTDGSRIVYCRGDASLWMKGYVGSSNWDIYSLALDKKDIPVVLTDYVGNDVFPCYSPDGKNIYFLREQEVALEENKKHPVYNLWKMDANGQNLVQITQSTSDILYFHLSKDGKKMLLEKDFQIWELNIEDGKSRQIPVEIASDTKSSSETTRMISEGNEMGSWSPDSREIAFSLNGDIWMMPAIGGKARQITSGPAKDEWPALSPDGKSLAYQSDKSGNSDIYILDLKTNKEIQITDHKSDDFYHSWSPDGKNILFTSERSGNRDIWIISSEGGIPRQLTNSPESEDDAVFSPDGKWIAFDSGKGGNQEIWMMPANGTYSEARQLTSHGGLNQVPTWSSDSQWIVYEVNNDQGQSSLWVISYKGGKCMQVAVDASLPRWSPDNNWILFESERAGKKNVYRIPAPAGIKDGDRIPFFAEMEVNLQAERAKVFEEAWKAIESGFYDAKFHGVDWEKIKVKYQPLAENAQTDNELSVIIHRMVGELKASHTGITMPEKKNKAETGEVGWTLSEVYGRNVLQIVDVLRDGPADKAWIRKGDYLFQVGEQLITPNFNINQILNNSIGKEIKIFISPGLNPKEGRYVSIVPVSSHTIAEIKYREWLMSRIQIVKSGCQGKVLYVHLKEMDIEHLKSFREIVQKARNLAEGMILDVRNNGGGNIHQELMDIFIRTPFIGYQSRDQKLQYQPAFYWNKPTVLLINERSFSDAEVFPYAFKALKRGYIVGMPTSGGVIGTRDITLSNQATFRVPRVGYYTLDGKNMEGMGVIPDFIVAETPKDRVEGLDPQLQKAIEVIMLEINKKKEENKENLPADNKEGASEKNED